MSVLRNCWTIQPLKCPSVHSYRDDAKLSEILKNKMTKFQNYKHYKLPITLNPLEYGKLIIQIDKLFVVQFNRTNVVLITQHEGFNQVKFYKEGDLIFNYKDHKINDSTFIRSLENKRFTFKIKI